MGTQHANASSGTRPGAGRWSRAAAASFGLLAALALGCAAPSGPRPGVATPAAEAAAGLDLYAAGEFAMAARRFGAAAAEARRCGDRDLERRTRAAECTAWLRAGQMPRFAACTERLETLQARARHSDPGVNTLLALGAIAGQRPAPPLRLPRDVRRVLRDASGEGR